MRGFAGSLFTLCSAVSLVLCVAASWFWLGQHAFPDTFLHTSPLEMDGHIARRVEWRVSRFSGRVWVSRVEAAYTAEDAIRAQAKSRIGWDHLLRSPPAFAMYTGTTEQVGRGWVARIRGIALPLPIAVVLTAVLPAKRAVMFVRQRRRLRRNATGRCSACGYDLRASPGQCPECGAARAGRPD